MGYWLLKTEPEEYSIEDLRREGEAIWDGVRNHLAKRHLLSMAKGDLAFIYHSRVETPGVVGLALVAETGLPDPSQFDPKSPYFDPKASPLAPRWYAVRLRFLEAWPLIPLKALRPLFPSDHPLNQRGNRLSVMPVPPEAAQALLAIARKGSR